MQHCVLCGSDKTSLLDGDGSYCRCLNCDLIFLKPEHRLSFEDEKQRYQQHNNDVHDPRYRSFMTPLFNEIIKNLSAPSLGLDFGAGEGPMLATMLEEVGHKITLYDPMFFESHQALDNKYAFVAASESAEHFYSPLLEFERMVNTLNENGFLAIMTSLVTDKIDFKNWYYKKDPAHVVFYSKNTFEWLRNYFKFRKMEINLDKIIILQN